MHSCNYFKQLHPSVPRAPDEGFSAHFHRAQRGCGRVNSLSVSPLQPAAQAKALAVALWLAFHGLWVPETVQATRIFASGGPTGSLQPRAQGPGRGSWPWTHSKLRPGTSWEDLALDHTSSGELPRQGHPHQLGKPRAGPQPDPSSRVTLGGTPPSRRLGPLI